MLINFIKVFCITNFQFIRLYQKKKLGDLSTMAYVIFEVKTDDVGKVNTLLKDDLVGRQSILTRDANSLGVDKEVSYVKIEGSEEGLKKAEDIAKDLGFDKLDVKEAEDVNKKIEEQEDSAASGMGMIFD